jgi:hypothetical protein
MRRHLLVFVIIAGGTFGTSALAQDAEDEDSLKPTEIGVRFTPEIAGAMTKKFVSAMKSRYGLDEQQVEEITPVMQRQFMKFAGENAALGRDMIEMMMATVIENDGSFPKDAAIRFGKLANQFTPRLQEFFTQAGGEIGKKMTVKQRLQFTGDVGLAAAGLLTFENRMKRWEEGKVSENANPFFDMPGDGENAASQPADPNEHEEHRKARAQVERWIKWQLNPDEQWPKYLDQAAKYYGFSEKQITAGKAILKDCQERAKAIKSREWQASVKELQIVQHLSNSVGDEFSNGPWMNLLNDSQTKLMKPINDLGQEFKRRIDDLSDSTQRATARESVRKLLADKGVKQLPI